MEFSVIQQDPVIRALVQENLLERKLHEALFPEQLFRQLLVDPEEWPDVAGDTQVFTRSGVLEPNQKPVVPGQDPGFDSYGSEQWQAKLNTYGRGINTHVPTSRLAISDLLVENTKKIAMQAAQSLNRNVRNRAYNAALSGHTTALGAQAAVTALRVTRLNGFTTARRPDLPSGSPVQFARVSASNPLKIQVFDNAGPAFVERTVTDFTPDFAGDEVGPGTLTLAGGAVTVNDRAAVQSLDRTAMVRVGGGESVDSVDPTDVMTSESIASAVARFRTMNVPAHGDGYYRAHLDPVSESQIMGDPTFQRLHTSLPDAMAYKELVLKIYQGVSFYRNNECPQAHTVPGSGTNFASQTYNTDGQFAGEQFNATSVRIHRVLFSGMAGIKEYYRNLMMDVTTEAGLVGRVENAARFTQGGVEIFMDRIQIIWRAPLNVFQDQIATAWKAMMDWPVPTDVTTGDGARFKRLLTMEHGA